MIERKPENFNVTLSQKNPKWLIQWLKKSVSIEPVRMELDAEHGINQSYR